MEGRREGEDGDGGMRVGGRRRGDPREKKRSE
jgi:hypothetical protein